MHLVSVDPESKSSRHRDAGMSNSRQQAKDQNLMVNLQILEAEKKTSIASPVERKVLEDQFLIAGNRKRRIVHEAMGLQSLIWLCSVLFVTRSRRNLCGR